MGRYASLGMLVILSVCGTFLTFRALSVSSSIESNHRQLTFCEEHFPDKATTLDKYLNTFLSEQMTNKELNPKEIMELTKGAIQSKINTLCEERRDSQPSCEGCWGHLDALMELRNYLWSKRREGLSARIPVRRLKCELL